MRSAIFSVALLSACSSQVSASDGPLFQEDYASVAGIMQAIETCKGFGEDWDGWLEARKSDGWVVTNLGSSTNPSEIGANYMKSAWLRRGTLVINAFLGRSSSGYVGKSGRCDVLVKIRSYDDEKRLTAEVRSRMSRVRPDWNSITYFSPTGKLSFNEEKSVPDGKPITFYVQVGYDDTHFEPKK